jgi:hypothetical protein
MTEAEWLDCSETWPMLQDLRGKTSARKLRLFACACCRRIDERYIEPASRHLLETTERFAERLAKKPALQAAAEALQEVRVQRTPDGAIVSTARDNPPLERAREAVFSLSLAPNESADNASVCAAWVAAYKADRVRTSDRFRAALDSEVRAQTELLRHIVGNPFRFIVGRCSATIVALAQTLGSGSDCAFALHDALLEAGHAELAEHFRDKDHPKGCWALDLILGKK